MNIDLIDETKYYDRVKIECDSELCDGCGFLREDYEGDHRVPGGLNKFYECHATCGEDCFRVVHEVQDAIQRVKDTKLEDIGSDLSAWNDLNKQERLELLEEMVEVELDA